MQRYDEFMNEWALWMNHLPNGLSWQNWTWHICQVLKTEQKCCCPHCRCHHLGYSVPPAHHSHHLVPKHLRATWPRPEQSHLIPEACSANGTWQQTATPRDERIILHPNPATVLRDFTIHTTTNYAIIWKWCLNYTAHITLSILVTPYGVIRF